MYMLTVLARVLLAAPFVFGGLHYRQTAKGREALARKMHVPAPKQAALADAVVKGVGGALLAAGVKPRTAAAVLAINLIPTTLGAHRFWELPHGEERETKKQSVILNAGIIGGLTALASLPDFPRERE